MSEEAGLGKFRKLPPGPGWIVRGLLTSLAVLGGLWALELHHFFATAIFKEQYLALILVIALVATFIGTKARKRGPADHVPWYDWCLAGLSVLTGGHIVIFFPRLVLDLAGSGPDRWLLGGVAILLILEATRRLTGWSLVVLALVFILYTKFSGYMPGVLNIPGAEWDRIAAYLYLDANAIYGLPLDVTSSMIIAFILFGRLLYAVKGDKFLTDFALLSMGRFRGGPAKVAVIASSFFGTISGSAVSNVVMDGPITIPMMKRSGYPAHLAAATEAVASTGGQIMPPVMGITAFLIAEFLQITYAEVILAAIIPAVLYYVALFVQVDLEAARWKMSALAVESLPKLANIMGRGWVFMIPIAVLIWTLIGEGWRPGKSAMAAAITTLVVSMFRADTRPSLKDLARTLEDTGRTVLDLVVITSIAGMVIGALQLSALASNFSLLLLDVSGGNVFVLLGMTALACIFLGMGMPTGIIYMLLAVMLASALTEFGIKPISAHLFLFYFGMLSMVTPPVCLATFAAASIAETDFWRAGWVSMRLAVVAYIVPFVMVFQPALVGDGTIMVILLSLAKAVVGVAVISVAAVGYLFERIGLAPRVLFGAAGLMVLAAPLTHWLTGLGLGMAVILLLWARQTRTIDRPTGAT